MKIHEYQARELLASYGVPVPPGRVARSAEEAVHSAEEIGLPVVIKAQVLVGGRGKAGGVKLAGTEEEVREAANKILTLTIKDIPVEAILVAKAIDIRKEYYLSVTVDRANKKALCIVSASGGVDIEELAVKEPEKILKYYIDPLEELLLGPAMTVPLALDAAGLGLDEVEVVQLHEAFAAQVLAVLKLLDDEEFCRDRLGRDAVVGAIDRRRLNTWGGSASLGHPFGATGARLITNCCHRLEAEKARHGLVAACAAGAVGIGLVFERFEEGGE